MQKGVLIEIVCLQEMDDDRRFAIKKAILDYVLLDEQEQERLGVPIPPKVRSLVLLL